MGAVEQVGARLVLLDADTFRANLQAATEALAAFNDEQERAAELAKETAGTISDSAEESADAVKTSAGASADAVKAEATETVAARDAIVGAQSDIAGASELAAEKVGAASDAVVVSQGKVADASVAASAKVDASWDAAVAGSTKILKWGSIVAAVVGYEGVKKFLTYNQQVTQLGINAGLSAKQLPALAAGFLKISDATGMSATNVATMAYYLASANPQIKTTTASLLAMAQQAANLDVMAGASADPTAISRMYGAVVSNAIPITVGGKAPTYSTATGTALNEWANAVTGHGDVTLGALTSALGTGILPLAKTFGLSLNQVGAMFDVLSPAMDASSAATRLKTAISMMGAPTASSRQAYELFGANATTPGAILRSKGPQAMLTYLSNMLSGKVTGSTFANAFYGSGLGAATGGTKGVGSGAGEYLRVMGFTPAQIAVMESAGGIASFAKMTPAQLQATGFAKGTTGAVAEQTVMTDFLSQMMGGGRTGAAVMQLINERGTLATKTAQIAGAENPKTYGAQLKLAFAEPIVVFHQLEQQFENLTIRIGQDVTPAVVSFGKDLLAAGQWLGKNKWALEALGAAAGSIVAGAAVIKTISVGEKIVSGVKYLLTGSGLSSGPVAANTGALTANTAAIEGLTGRMSVGGLSGGGLTPGEEGGAGGLFASAPVLGIATAAGALYGLYKAANWASEQLTGFGKTAAALAFKAPSATKAPAKQVLSYLNNPAIGPTGVQPPSSGAPPRGKVAMGDAARFNLAVQDAASGKAMPSWLVSQLTPQEMGTITGYEKTPAGTVLHGAYGTKTSYTKTWAPPSLAAQSAWQQYLAGSASPLIGPVPRGATRPSTPSSSAKLFASLGPAQQSFVETSSAFPKALGVSGTAATAFVNSMARATTMRTAGGENKAMVNAEGQLIAAAVKQQDAADHGRESANQLSDAAKQETATLSKFLNAASQQTNAANTTQTAAFNLTSAASQLETAAGRLGTAAANAATAFSPANIHSAAVAGTKQSVARK
jgi:hypothetical protein